MSASHAGPALVILTKPPVPGRCKTRLIPALGAEGAARLHAALVELTVERALASGLPVTVSLDGPLDSPFALGLLNRGLAVEAQAAGDLGARLLHALRGPGRRIALGTDLPGLDPRQLQIAAESQADVVFGPALDGGYWTVGVGDRARAADLWRELPWSTPALLERSLARAAASGLTVHLLPVAYDLDEPADLDRLSADPAAPPSLLACLPSPLLAHRPP